MFFFLFMIFKCVKQREFETIQMVAGEFCLLNDVDLYTQVCWSDKPLLLCDLQCIIYCVMAVGAFSNHASQSVHYRGQPVLSP